jgi:hypothetical protein
MSALTDLTLPGPLATLLNDLGYTWTQTKEGSLLDMGSSWVGIGGQSRQPADDAHGAAQQVWSENRSQGVDAFQASWNHPQSPHANLSNAATAATGIGVGLLACAGIVLALKVNTIVQLTTLAIEIAEAIATVPVTFGASLLEIPAFKEVAGMAIGLLINIALSAIMGR